MRALVKRLNKEDKEGKDMKDLVVTKDMQYTAEGAAKWLSPLGYRSLARDLGVVLAMGKVCIHFNRFKTRVYVRGIRLNKRELRQLAECIREDYKVVVE